MPTSDSAFERKLDQASRSKFHGPVIDVMDTFDLVVSGLKESKVQFSASDAVRLTELILDRVGPDEDEYIDSEPV